MSDDGRKWNWWLTLGAPLLVTVLGGWILSASEALPTWITGLFAAIPPLAYWSLLWSISVAVAFGAGQAVERSRGVTNREKETQTETEAVADTEWVTATEAATEAEPARETAPVTDTELVTATEAASLVQESNYWSRVKRRRALDLLELKYEAEEWGLEEPEPFEVESAAIVPPRHTPNVAAVLQHFWDDHPTGRDGESYHRDTLRDWLEEQAYEVELPSG